MIAKIAIANDVRRIVIGKVQKSKNQTNKLSSIVNQMWHLLPHGKVTKYLKYKLEKYNIKVDLVDESYTSVTDSCDVNTRVTKNTIGNGRRIKRGLFLSPIKGLINADVNGARNILRKTLRKWNDLVTGLGRVIKIRLYRFSRKVSPNPVVSG